MANISPQEAENEALDILNRVIYGKRAISEFENAKIMNCLDSLHRANSDAYSEIAVCYYSQIGDIDNMLSEINNISNHNKKADWGNLIFAMNNAMRYKELYSYIKDRDIFINEREFFEIAIKTTSFCGDDSLADYFTSNYNENYDDEESRYFLIHINEMRSFFKSNHEIKQDLHAYLIDCLDVFSRVSLQKSKLIDSAYGYSHHIYSDEGHKFLAFSFIFQADETYLDEIIDLEDEFLSLISVIDYNTTVKTKVSFNFELGELS